MAPRINKHILGYIEAVESGAIVACKEQVQLVAHIRKCFETEDIYVDEDQLKKYLAQVKYFPFDRLFPWEEFIFTLWNCTYWKSDNRPRWPTILCLLGRGAGKDGYIGFDSWCSMTPYNGIAAYHVDICANNEEQAMMPLNDVLDVLENPQNMASLKRHFYWNKEKVVGLKTKSTMKGRTNSPKGKDGLRSGKVFFNEIHQYENYDNINVFTTGLGKKPHPRRGYFTTQGDVRDGPLDDLIETSLAILRGDEPDNGFLPFICRLDDKKEVHDERMWEKANPSLPYRPDLLAEIRQEYREWQQNPERLPAFMTKRMNIPDGTADIRVADYENIKRTNKALPDLEGWDCVVGIDFVKVGDFASVNHHFKQGDKRYDINHSWLCTNSKDLPRINAPWREWAQAGLLTVVDDVEIHPELICQYINDLGQQYNTTAAAIDNFRYALLKRYLSDIGFEPKQNLFMVQPSNIMKVIPIIDRCFDNDFFTWGDNPVLRWATNNTKKQRRGRASGEDTGNFYYAKIEGRSRKTDPFMALVASMTIEDQLQESAPFEIPRGLEVLTW